MLEVEEEQVKEEHVKKELPTVEVSKAQESYKYRGVTIESYSGDTPHKVILEKPTDEGFTLLGFSTCYIDKKKYFWPNKIIL